MKHLFEKGKNRNRTLLLLHGTGGDENDLIPLAKHIDSEANILSVRGNVLENGMPRFFKRLAEGVFDEEDLIFRTNELNDFLSEAAETYSFDIEKYNKAKKRIKELKEFYSHLASYLVVIPFLIFINLYFSPKHIWFYWPMLGWGIGLFFHALGVFNIFPFFGKDWDDKKIKEIMEKEKNTKWE